MYNHTANLYYLGILFLTVVLGCNTPNNNSTSRSENVSQDTADSSAKTPESSIEIQANTLTKEYEDNELAADGKYKDKPLKVSGKISNIAETLGNITVQLKGHKFIQTVMCSFEEAEKESVLKLKKGQKGTFTGRGDGMTAGLYVGLRECKVAS